MDFFNFLVLISIILIGIGFFINIKTYYYPTLFFLIKFIAGQIINFERVRNQVVFQLIIIFFIVLIVLIKQKGKVAWRDKFFYKSIPWLVFFVLFNSLYGAILGHQWFQILIDSYKYLEIIVYYFLFRICWNDNISLFKGLKSICFIMIFVGIIELFITARGGIGLNLVMSFLPIILLLGANGYIKYYKIVLIISSLIVFLCQTRTYIVCFLIGFILTLFNIRKDKRNKIIFVVFVLGIITFVGISLGNSALFYDTISRFTELTNGFSESGGYRIDEYIIALNKFVESPIFGNGFGYLEFLFINKMGWMYWGDFIHCVYIEILFKTGIFGFVSIVMIVSNFVSKIYKKIKYLKKQNVFIFSICCGSVISFFVWLLTYTFAPLNTYGSIFIGLLVASIALSNYHDEFKV